MLQCRGLSVRYSDTIALDAVDLSLADGEIVALLGPSGSGKTTLLRVIAGLEHPEEGSVSWDGVDITDLQPHLRRFGLMFQQYALFPHKSVAGNVGFGLSRAGMRGPDLKRRVDEALAWVGLEGQGERAVEGLSGGEQQRVALARTLATRPRLVMLDEPLGALDKSLRERLMDEISVLLRDHGMTALYVTHDHEEATRVADRIAVMQSGKILQTGTIEEIRTAPATPWIAGFLG